MGRKPVPYLLAVAMASNVGSTATITGNPQNIMIGSFSHIPYVEFRRRARRRSRWSGLIVTIALIVLFHREEFAGARRSRRRRARSRFNRASCHPLACWRRR